MGRLPQTDKQGNRIQNKMLQIPIRPEFYELAKLCARETGLPMTHWVRSLIFSTIKTQLGERYQDLLRSAERGLPI